MLALGYFAFPLLPFGLLLSCFIPPLRACFCAFPSSGFSLPDSPSFGSPNSPRCASAQVVREIL
jgi:hypothetical protein